MEVRFIVGDITKLEVDAIVNPANSEGEMGGGLAAVLKRAAGKKIELEAMEQAPIPIGKAIATSAGKLKCDYVFHSPTMMVPVQRTSVENIQKATQAALQLAKEYEIKKLAIPGMGTGTGRVAPVDAAASMIEVILKFSLSRNILEELILVDKNEDMVAAWEQCWKGETQPETEPESEPEVEQPD